MLFIPRPRCNAISFPGVTVGSQNEHLVLLENVGQVAATTVLTILHGGHEDTGTDQGEEDGSSHCEVGLWCVWKLEVVDVRELFKLEDQS